MRNLSHFKQFRCHALRVDAGPWRRRSRRRGGTRTSPDTLSIGALQSRARSRHQTEPDGPVHPYGHELALFNEGIIAHGQLESTCDICADVTSGSR